MDLLPVPPPVNAPDGLGDPAMPPVRKLINPSSEKESTDALFTEKLNPEPIPPGPGRN